MYIDILVEENYNIKNILTNENYNFIIDFYNKNKDESWGEIESLKKVNGGFKIKHFEKFVDINPFYFDENDKFRQLRLYKCSNNSIKLCPNYFITFRDHEIQLLYKALCHIFKDKVILHNGSSYLRN
jgi:hypothetical protein